MRLVAVWYAQNSLQLSSAARDALDGVDADGGIVVSVATLIDLWYVTRTTEGVTRTELGGRHSREEPTRSRQEGPHLCGAARVLRRPATAGR